MAYNWTQRTPAHSPPDIFNSQMAYHVASGKTVLIDEATGNTWLWDGSDWTQAAPSTAAPATGTAGMAYDVNRGVVVLWGGALAGGGFNTATYEWDGTNWAHITTAHTPASRTIFYMEWCANIGKIVMFGGRSAGSTALSDTWSYDGTDWVQLSPSAHPPAREGVSGSSDLHGNVVIFDGLDPAGPTGYEDTWKFDGTTWTQVTTASNPHSVSQSFFPWPMARDGSGRIVWYGDDNTAAGNNTRQTWTFDGTNWTQLSPAAAPSMAYANGEKQLAYDSARGETVMFVHKSGSSPETWVWVDTSPPPPSGVVASLRATFGPAA